MTRVHAALALLLTASLLVGQNDAPRPTRPHILVLLADDLGWTDLSSGSTNLGHASPYYSTPHLEELCRSGISFTAAYSSAPNCAPTRAALFSGKWSARTGIYTVVSGNRGRAEHRKLQAARNSTELAADIVTLPERLRERGYQTGFFGKWHLGDESKGTGPTDQGFDFACGGNSRGGVGKLGNFSNEDGAFALPGLDSPGPRAAPGVQFLADRLTDESIAWLGTAQGPTFCFVSHYSVHTPIQAPADEIPAAPPPDGSRHRNAKYAGMLANLDGNIGRLIRWLESEEDPSWPGHRRIENTLVVFTSDNGGLGGYRDAGIDGGGNVTHNHPLRSGKGSLHEGGIRVPCIVRWDAMGRQGAVDPTPLQTLDLYPSLLAAAGVEIPADLDGVDLSPRFGGEPIAPVERSLYWHFPGYLEANARRGSWRQTPGSAIRRGRHKLIWLYESSTAQLYDLQADIGESTDLAAEQPDLRDALLADLRSWLASTNAPLPLTLEGEPVSLPR
jgi:arylsulfatase A-like enzyme